MELFFEFFFECLVQLFGDVVLDALLRSRNPIANTIGNTLVACLAAGLLAGISLTVHSRHLIANPEARIVALVALPFINGFLMSWIGRRYLRLGRMRSGFEHFLPAFGFSLIFGLVRLVGAH